MEQFSRRSCARRPGTPIRTNHHHVPTTDSPDMARLPTWRRHRTDLHTCPVPTANAERKKKQQHGTLKKNCGALYTPSRNKDSTVIRQWVLYALVYLPAGPISRSDGSTLGSARPAPANCLQDYNSSYCGPYYSAALLPHLTKRPPHISHVRLMLPRFVRSVTWCSFIADGCGAITIYQTFSSLAYCGWLSAHRRPDVVGLI